MSSGRHVFFSAVDVHVNRCLDNITAGGVQICGLHATVAPRRQQQQTPPTLEEFVFTPLVETDYLLSSDKLAEQLRHSKGKFLSSLISSMFLIRCEWTIHLNSQTSLSS